jgi:hypothetical protein
LGQTWEVVFSPYTWNLEGKLRNLQRPPFRGIEMPFLFLCNCEDLSLPQVFSTVRLLCHLNQRLLVPFA